MLGWFFWLSLLVMLMFWQYSRYKVAQEGEVESGLWNARRDKLNKEVSFGIWNIEYEM